MRKLQRVPLWYFAGAIVGDRSHQEFYQAAVSALKETGKVWSEHVAYPDVQAWESKQNDNVFLRDFRGLRSSKGLVADISMPTTGGGGELEFALNTDIPVCCVYLAGEEAQTRNIRPSPYVLHRATSGTAPNLTVQPYENKEQLEKIVREFAQQELKARPLLAGAYFVLEGPDGAGKTTQWKLVLEHLKQQGYDVLSVREPGGTLLGEEVRNILLNKNVQMTPYAELFLFSSARVQLFEESILPAMHAGKLAVSDRNFLSTNCYQGGGRGMNRSVLHVLNTLATKHTDPDYCLVLDAPGGVLDRRKGSLPKDRIEKEGAGFHDRVRQAYKDFCCELPNAELISIMDGDRELTVDELFQTVKSRIDTFLKDNFREA
ncbi:dTMP kinase [Candidatus Woesearchaeota archaeon]|nr:dTMP kinase [Candidatus Woesearchaeota archaeon]